MTTTTTTSNGVAATTTTTTSATVMMMPPTTNDYEVGVVIGEGSFGRVFHGRHKASGRDVAIKVFDKVEFVRRRPEFIRTIWMERYILQEFRSNPSVVNLWSAFTDEQCVYLVMECLKGGDLSLLIQEGFQNNENENNKSNNDNNKTWWWRTDVVPYYALQLIEAVEFLHQHSTIHCDLKPANILCDERGRIRLGDFGSAIRIENNNNNNSSNVSKLQNNNNNNTQITISKNNKAQRKSNNAQNNRSYDDDSSSAVAAPTAATIPPMGTVDYASPELLRGQEVGIATDLWSLGCIFVALHWGESPFHEASDALALDRIIGYANSYHSDGGDSSNNQQQLDDDDDYDDLPPLLNRQAFRELPKGWDVLILGLLNPNPSIRLGDFVVDDVNDEDNNGSSTTTSTTTSMSKLVPGHEKVDLNSPPPFLPPEPKWIMESKKTKMIDGSRGWSSFLL